MLGLAAVGVEAVDDEHLFGAAVQGCALKACAVDGGEPLSSRGESADFRPRLKGWV